MNIGNGWMIVVRVVEVVVVIVIVIVIVIVVVVVLVVIVRVVRVVRVVVLLLGVVLHWQTGLTTNLYGSRSASQHHLTRPQIGLVHLDREDEVVT
jgi:hypothetical protein